jgi:hypothetical protein
MRNAMTAIFAAALLLASGGTARAGTTQILTAYHAGASFSSTDAEGITTEVFIDANRHSLQTLPGGETEQSSWFNLAIRQCEGDFCGKGTPLLWSASGRVENPDLAIATNLSRANLRGDVTLVCEAGTCPESLSVEFTWIATSPPISTAGSTHGPDEGLIIADAGLRREAVAFGIVSDGTTNYAPNPDFAGHLGWVRTHRITP